MKITIFGAGAIGAQIAARLAQQGFEVAVVARGENLDAIKSRGIELVTGDIRRTSTVVATSDSSELGPQDVVIVTVKAHGLEQAATAIRPLVGEHTRLLYIMNGIPWWFMDGTGIDTTPPLHERFDPHRRIASLTPAPGFAWGVIRSGGAMLAPGIVRNTTPNANELVVGSPFGPISTFDKAIDALTRAGYRMTVSDNIRREIWSKLLLNAGPAVVSSVAGLDNLTMVEDTELRFVATEAVREIIQVGEAIGLRLEIEPESITDPARTYRHVPSLLQDLRAGRPVEIAHTILAVRDIARATGVPVPHLATLAALIASRAAGRED